MKKLFIALMGGTVVLIGVAMIVGRTLVVRGRLFLQVAVYRL